MEPATADSSLLTDTATSDTTGSVGTVVSDESDGSMVESVGTVAGDEIVVSVVTVVTGSVEIIVVGSFVSVELYCTMVYEQDDCLLTSHIKDESIINKWRSVASQGIVSLTEIFSCI